MDVDGDGLPDVGGHDAYGNADYSGPGGTTYDAIAIGFSHDNGGHDASFGSVTSNGQFAVQHSHSHMVNGPDGVLSREIELVDKDTRLFIARGVKHGDIDVWAVLAQVAPRLNLVRLDQIRPALDGIKITKEELADQADPWREPYDLINSPPPGWYAGATGRTKMELQIWQVGTRTDNWDKFRASILSLLGWNQLKKTAGFDKKARTYFEVRKVTWCFRETQDFSTVFSLYIHSSNVWQSYFREY
ncbi:MAG: hypothetical protein IAF58_13460, partial [Leptolyngbya sp.]|nr:hypothetical protein [Candidatus Melainabacteria bacterium]